jgi:hypothetical protein
MARNLLSKPCNLEQVLEHIRSLTEVLPTYIYEQAGVVWVSEKKLALAL